MLLSPPLSAATRSHDALCSAVRDLSAISDEAVVWLVRVALKWLAVVVLDMPSLEPAGHFLMAAILGAAPDVCRLGCGLLLRKIMAGELQAIGWGLG